MRSGSESTAGRFVTRGSSQADEAVDRTRLADWSTGGSCWKCGKRVFRSTGACSDLNCQTYDFK